jgi:hypothetical protein
MTIEFRTAFARATIVLKILSLACLLVVGLPILKFDFYSTSLLAAIRTGAYRFVIPQVGLNLLALAGVAVVPFIRTPIVRIPFSLVPDLGCDRRDVVPPRQMATGRLVGLPSPVLVDSCFGG